MFLGTTPDSDTLAAHLARCVRTTDLPGQLTLRHSGRGPYFVASQHPAQCRGSALTGDWFRPGSQQGLRQNRGNFAGRRSKQTHAACAAREARRARCILALHLPYQRLGHRNQCMHNPYESQSTHESLSQRLRRCFLAVIRILAFRSLGGCVRHRCTHGLRRQFPPHPPPHSLAKRLRQEPDSLESKMITSIRRCYAVPHGFL